MMPFENESIPPSAKLDVTTTKPINSDSDAPGVWVRNPSGRITNIPADYAMPDDEGGLISIVKLAELGIAGWSIPDPADIPRGTAFGHPDDDKPKPKPSKGSK
jgi:hypothetical protein